MIQRLAIALLVFASAPLAAGAMTPDQIASAPRVYNGQHVEVTGRVTHVHPLHLRNGTTYVRFSVCATRCIHAVVSGAAALTEGETITVHGTYYGWKNLGTYTVRNGVEIDPGSL
jgi:hypothetical protein